MPAVLIMVGTIEFSLCNLDMQLFLQVKTEKTFDKARVRGHLSDGEVTELRDEEPNWCEGDEEWIEEIQK